MIAALVGPQNCPALEAMKKPRDWRGFFISVCQDDRVIRLPPGIERRAPSEGADVRIQA